MAKNYREYKYFENRPDVVKIFEDLEKFHDYCRFEMLPFNPSDLYNRHSRIWTAYDRGTNPHAKRYYKNKHNSNSNTNRGSGSRSHNTRSNNNNNKVN